MPSYKEELEAMCTVPGAEYLFLRPRCHPDSAITAAYSKSQGAIIIACSTCNFGVADLAVASRAAGGLSNMMALPRITEAPPRVLPPPPVIPKAKGRPQLAVVQDTPNHTQDQRKAAKANRRRRK